MNDDNNIPENPSADTALEARIVAWVAGEASDFEIAELSRVLVEKPELAVFKKRIETVHNLLGEAARPEKTPLQLSPERRAKLLAALGAAQNPAASGNANSPSDKTDGASVLVYPISQKRRILWMKGLSVACSLMLTFMILRVTVLAPKPGSAPAEIYPVEMPPSSKVFRSSARTAAADKKAQDEVATPTADLDERDSLDTGATGSAAPASVTLGMQSVQIPKPANPKGAPINQIPIDLEPAQVTADTEMSYSASSTLAGSRIRTELPDLGAKTTLHYFGTTLSSELDRHAAQTSTPLSRESVFKQKETLGSKGGKSEPAFNNSDPVVLSPFSVSSDQAASGYIANNTLAGTRVRTDLKDASSAISAVTSQFLADTSATSKAEDPRENKLTGTSTEATTWRSFNASIESDSPLLKKQVFSDSVSSKEPPAGTFAPPAEISSSDGISGLQRGPNSILFGVGSPSGLVDKNSDQALRAKVSPPETKFSLEEISAGKQSVSTFSLHVGDTSFKLAVAALARGELPDPASIRPEEFYNAFDYNEPAPAMAEKVSCRIEQSAHPELQQRNFLRIALRVPSTGRGAGQPLRLTVLLDTSGSMQRDDRAAAVRKAMDVLVSLLGPNDRVTLIGFSRTPRLLAESVPGDQARSLLKMIAETPAEGGTNLEAALKLAGELAHRQQEISAQNRIILLTDGAANLGDADPAKLAHAIVTLRQQGIAFDACGVGLEGVDDNMLETLTRDGDGRYTILSSADSAGPDFARQLAGAFRPAAKNVKVQVRFNPARVGQYKLIGFEQHRLKEEDFRNDQIDAAELAADEAAVALYQVEPLPQGEGELGEVYVRFQDTATGNMVERSWTLPYDAHTSRFDRASPAMQLTGASALVAEKLQGGPVKLDDLVGPVNALRGHYKNEGRVQDFITMFAELRRIDHGK